MTLTRTTAGAYVPGTGVTESTVTYSVTGVKLDYEQSVMDGTLIRVGDQRVYAAPSLSVTPKAGDKLTIGSEVWDVIKSSPLSPAGTVVLHDIQVRKQ